MVAMWMKKSRQVLSGVVWRVDVEHGDGSSDLGGGFGVWDVFSGRRLGGENRGGVRLGCWRRI